MEYRTTEIDPESWATGFIDGMDWELGIVLIYCFGREHRLQIFNSIDVDCDDISYSESEWTSGQRVFGYERARRDTMEVILCCTFAVDTQCDVTS